MKKWLGSLAAAFLIFAAGFNYYTRKAEAGVFCSVPFNLTNGTTADASQVMANYNAIIACLLNAAAAGANTDITALLGLTTPISPTQGGSTVFIGTTPSASGNTIVISGTTPGSFSYTNGYTVVFLANAANVSTATINVNNQGNVNLFKQSTGGPIALTGGEVATGQIVFATWDGTQFEINPVPNVSPGFGLANNASGTSIQINPNQPPYGFDMPVNLGLTASVTSNVLQVNITQANGQTPSSTSSGPVLIPFRNPIASLATPAWVAITGATSINTNAAGATLGTNNSTPFRFWIVAFDNNGVVVPALFNAVQATTTLATPTATPANVIFPLDETSNQTTVAVSAASKSPGVFYTPNGTTITSQPFKILGYLEYSSGLGTAGSYASLPTKLQLFGPTIKKPGDVIQTITNTSSVGATTNSSTFTALSSAFTLLATPTSAANLMEVQFLGNVNGGGNTQSYLQLTRNGTLFGFVQAILITIAQPNAVPTTMDWLDFPGTTSVITYSYQGRVLGGDTITVPASGTSVTLKVREIQG